jgi:hypothetical protein
VSIIPVSPINIRAFVWKKGRIIAVMKTNLKENILKLP